MQHERGNILFLILLAIILFAALTYAVNGGSRVAQDQALPKEKARSAAAEILQKATLAEQTVTRLMLVKGCRDIELSFDSTLISYNNPNAPSDKHCHVFDPVGGGMTNLTFDPSYFDPTRTGPGIWGRYSFTQNRIPQVGTDCTGGGCDEIMLVVPFLKKEVCDELIKIGGKTSIPQVSGQIQMNKFIGDFDTSAKNFGGSVDNQRSMCVQGRNAIYGANGLYENNGDAIGTYHFYHVLVAR